MSFISKQPLALAALLLFGLGTGGLPGAEAGTRWESSIPQALKRARGENRLVLVDFWRDQCPWCVRLERETFADERVARVLGDFVPVKAKDTDHPEEIKRYAVEGFPTIALLDSGGEPIDLYVGYMPADGFLAWLLSTKDQHLRTAFLKERIRKDPADLDALLALGRIFSGDGKREEARRHLEAILRADPESKRMESAEAHIEIGLTWRRNREYRRALESISKARTVALRLLETPRETTKDAAPGGPPLVKGASGEAAGGAPPADAASRPRREVDLLDRALHELATTQLLLGMREDLVETLEEYDARVSTPDPRRHSWALLQLGLARRKTGALEAAKRAFRRCDELYPRSSEARECRQELAALEGGSR